MIMEINGRQEAGLCWMCLEKKNRKMMSEETEYFNARKQAQQIILTVVLIKENKKKTLHEMCNSVLSTETAHKY